MTSPSDPPVRPDIADGALRSSRSFWREIRVVAETGSTNADLVASGKASGVVLVADFQHGGRGRLDRAWTSPPRAGLMFSALVDCGPVPPARWAWLPLLSGLAVLSAARSVAGVDAVLKWPNDLLVGPQRLKACGILVQAVPGRDQAVIGVGLNVTTTRDELPVPTATSLMLEGSAILDRGVLLDAILVALARHLDAWRAAAGDPESSGLTELYRGACATVGQAVRVSETSGIEWTGVATGIDPDGRLEVLGDDGVARAVGAGDVVHVRPV
ncbi:MAG: birA 1 [Pseudonocardiales bacterium]|nr:birA 1 [Pseudonocardiales bacterium]